MSCHEYEALLDEYVDDELDGARRDELERHLSGCLACRRTVDELRRLAGAVSRLPRGLAPERDLLPGIRAHTTGGGTSWSRWAGLAAALVLAFTLGWLGLRTGERRVAGGGENALPGDPDAPWSVALVNRAEFELAEEQYEQAAARLMQVFEERQDDLSPETRELVQQNLRIIDQAIAELHDALDTDPGDPRNGHALNSLYRQKVEFLWRMSRLSS